MHYPVSALQLPTITSADIAYKHLRFLAYEPQEVLVAIFLDSQKQILRYQEVFRGTLDSCPARPREVLREALLYNAHSILVAHNHPSQCLDPSLDDIRFTQNMIDAGSIIGVPLLDHLIVGISSFFSFRQKMRAQFRRIVRRQRLRPFARVRLLEHPIPDGPYQTG